LIKFNEYRIEPSEIDIKKYIKYIAQAWYNVTNKTIENCWVKADILLKDNHENEDDTGNDILLELKRLKEMEEVQVLIDKLDFDNLFSAEEFVKYDKSDYR